MGARAAKAEVDTVVISVAMAGMVEKVMTVERAGMVVAMAQSTQPVLQPRLPGEWEQLAQPQSGRQPREQELLAQPQLRRHPGEQEPLAQPQPHQDRDPSFASPKPPRPEPLVSVPEAPH